MYDPYGKTVAQVIADIPALTTADHERIADAIAAAVEDRMSDTEYAFAKMLLTDESALAEYYRKLMSPFEIDMMDAITSERDTRARATRH